jgi:pilin isopeptide linkage protein
VGILLAPAALAAETAQITLTVRQTFGGSDVPDNGAAYLLKPVTPGAPVPAGSGADGCAFTLRGTGETRVGPIAFTAQGIYTYELRCVSADRAGYTFDRKVYTMRVYVSNGSAVVTVTDGSGNKVTEAVYGHRFSSGRDEPSDPNLMPDPPVVNTILGTPAEASVFTFRLTSSDAANPMPKGSVGGVKTVRITGPGSAGFGTWQYTRAGVYRYAVSEIITGEMGYAYDTEVYVITDTVTAPNGRLEVSRVVANSAGHNVSSMAFVNTYKAGSSLLFGGNKSGGLRSAAFPAYAIPIGLAVVIMLGIAVRLLYKHRDAERLEE